MAKLSWLWVLFKVFMGLCDDDECKCHSFDKFEPVLQNVVFCFVFSPALVMLVQFFANASFVFFIIIFPLFSYNKYDPTYQYYFVFTEHTLR